MFLSICTNWLYNKGVRQGSSTLQLNNKKGFDLYSFSFGCEQVEPWLVNKKMLVGEVGEQDN